MGFMDDAISKGKSIAAGIGDKAGDLVDLGKLKTIQMELKKDIKESYENLGKAIYDAKMAGESFDDKLTEAVETISSLKEKLAETDEAMLNLSGKKTCPSCSETLPLDAQFCSKCGNKFPDTEED